MSKNWDQTLKDWADTINANDEARGKGARVAINDAIRASPQLASKNIDVFVTGSYRNDTNIRGDSDIDVAVVLRDVIFYELPADGSITREMLGFRNSDYTFEAWRDDVGAALRDHFGKALVTDGNKAFNVRPSGQRLDADVAVFLEHRSYVAKKKTPTGAWDPDSGVEMRPRDDTSGRIINWPDQHHAQGADKNDATNRRFKRLVRIFKHLRADMATLGDTKQRSGAGQVSSFFLECLVHNVPNWCFNLDAGGYLKDTHAALAWLGAATKPGAASNLVEVSGMQGLFREAPPRTQEQAYAFVCAAFGRVFGQEKLPW